MPPNRKILKVHTTTDTSSFNAPNIIENRELRVLQQRPKLLPVRVPVMEWTNMDANIVSAAAPTTTVTFTSTTTWVAPAGVTSIQVSTWAGGGGSGDLGGSVAGGGGGGGAYSGLNALTVIPGNSYTVTVGIGGTAASAGGSGGAGGDSWFSTSGTVLAKGGGAGITGSTGGAAGVGGATASGIGDIKHAGGDGAHGAPGGGGGGGGAGTTADGGAGSTSGSGGIGGTGGAVGGGTGGQADSNSPSAQIKGGGAGGGSGGVGGFAGARGEIQITYTSVAVVFNQELLVRILLPLRLLSRVPVFEWTTMDAMMSPFSYTLTKTEAITNTDTTLKATTRPLTDSITVTDTILRSITRTLTDAINNTDAVIRSTVRTLADAITITDTVIRSTARTLSEAITNSDTFASLLQHFKTLAESITVSDTLTRAMTRVLTDTTTVTDTVLKAIQRTISEAITLTDTFANLFVTGFTSENLNKLARPILLPLRKVMTYTTMDAMMSPFTFTAVKTESITVSDSLLKSLQRTLSDAITATDTFLKSSVRTLSEAITVTDTFLRSVTHVLTEAISVTDTAIRSSVRTLTESITVSDTFASVRGRFTSLTESITGTDVFARAITRVLAEAITLTDTALRSTARTFSESITLTDIVNATRAAKTAILTEAITLTDSLKRASTRVFTEAIVLTVTLIRRLNGENLIWTSVAKSVTAVWTQLTKPTVQIAFDNAAASAGLGTSNSYSHQVISSASVVFVGVTVFSGTVSAITYAGTTMTQIGTPILNAGGTNIYLFYMINPSVGTNTVAFTLSGSLPWASSASSYVSALTTVPDNTATATSTTSILSAAITPVAANCWTLAYAYQDSAIITPGVGSTARGTVTQSGLFDSNGSVSGTSVMNFAISGTNNSMARIISFAPARVLVPTAWTHLTKN